MEETTGAIAGEAIAGAAIAGAAKLVMAGALAMGREYEVATGKAAAPSPYG